MCIRDRSTLTFEKRVHLVKQYPGTVARHFMVRVNALLLFTKSNDHVLGSKMVDWRIRVEFQNRGSPHLHMLVWCDGIPDF